MKIKDTIKSYEEVCKIEKERHAKPVKQSTALRGLIKALSRGEMKAVDFSYETVDMDRLGKDEPCLILMNHSSFTDLQIIGTVFADRQYHIVCTDDGFVGKAGLMRRVGCIPTSKFIIDTNLVRDMKYAFETLKSSVVMYPEASYSFDGTQTPLPMSIAKCLKLMKVPVVMVMTEGAYLRDPLYNNLQKRETKVSAKITYLLSPDDILKKSSEELYDILSKAFIYDHFRTQHEHGVVIDETFRADGLHRALYKCPSCKKEGDMFGKGIHITCRSCKKEYTLEEDGTLSATDAGCEFRYVTDWYAWEREQVRKELEEGTYLLDIDVDIKMLVDTKSIYSVGEGKLRHTTQGFELDGCGGKLHYTQSPKASYSLYADYFWYEIGDMICIGDNAARYYCFPKDQEKAIVAKARLATEELYKMLSEKQNR